MWRWPAGQAILCTTYRRQLHVAPANQHRSRSFMPRVVARRRSSVWLLSVSPTIERGAIERDGGWILHHRATLLMHACASQSFLIPCLF